jgi:16S rRNA (guanine527-N7)-methyltransferase
VEHHTITTKNVSRETFKKNQKIFEKHHGLLDTYLGQLLWWNKRINLVSRNVPRETIMEHIFHSLLICQLEVFQSAETILDAGTGGGLPGLPLAITHPQKQFYLNDIVSKKCLATKQMVRKLGVENIQVVDASIHDVQQNGPFLLISKHAFKINDLYEMTAHLPWDAIVLLKGKEFKEELSGIDNPLLITSYDLSVAGDFYKGKTLIKIERS